MQMTGLFVRKIELFQHGGNKTMQKCWLKLVHDLSVLYWIIINNGYTVGIKQIVLDRLEKKLRWRFSTKQVT